MFYDTSPYPSSHPAFVGHHVVERYVHHCCRRSTNSTPFLSSNENITFLTRLTPPIEQLQRAWYCFQPTTTILVQNPLGTPKKIPERPNESVWGLRNSKKGWLELKLHQKSPSKKCLNQKPFVQKNTSNSKLRNTFRDTPRFEFKNFSGHETSTRKSPDRCYLLFYHPAQFEINKNSTTKPSPKIFKFEIQPINISKQPTWYVFLPPAQPPRKKHEKTKLNKYIAKLKVQHFQTNKNLVGGFSPSEKY